MSEICPQCGEPTLSKQNPFGLQTCESCYWVNTIQEPKTNYTPLLVLLTKWTGLFLLLATFVTLCFQFFIWREYSFDATYFQVKQGLGFGTEKDEMELGAICNSLGKTECAIEHFSKVLEVNPNNKGALANIGINFSKAEKWERARRHFEAYFSLGGSGYDVMLWYGRVIEQLDGPEEALDWSYVSLAAKPDYQEAARELIRQLVGLDRFVEALSVIGGMAEGHPDQTHFWREDLEKVYNQALLKNWGELEENEIRLPKVKGRHFYIPISFAPQKHGQLFAVDKSVEMIWVDEDFLYANQLDFPLVGTVHTIKWEDHEISGKEATLPEVFVREWKLKDVRVVVCRACPNIFGSSGLNLISSKLSSRHQTEFLVVQPKN